MKNLRKCAVVALLSYLLFAVVVTGFVLSCLTGEFLWALSFAAAFLGGGIAFIVSIDSMLAAERKRLKCKH